jgi:hypothetical protein
VRLLIWKPVACFKLVTFLEVAVALPVYLVRPRPRLRDIVVAVIIVVVVFIISSSSSIINGPS